MNIFPVVPLLVSAAVVCVAVVMYRGEVRSRRAQGRAVRAFIASGGRPVQGWPSCWAWSAGPSPRGMDAPSGVSVEGVAPVGVGGAS